MNSSFSYQDFLMKMQYCLLYNERLRQQQYLTLMSLYNSNYNNYLPNINQNTLFNNDYLSYSQYLYSKNFENKGNFSYGNILLQNKADNLTQNNDVNVVATDNLDLNKNQNIENNDTTFKKGNNFLLIYLFYITKIFIENNIFLTQKRKRKENLNEFEKISGNYKDKGNNSETTLSLSHSNNKGDDESYCSTPKTIKFKTKKNNIKTKEKKHHKSNVISHPDYQSTKTPEEFMKYNFNFENDINIQKEENKVYLEEDNYHVNLQKINDNFSLISGKTELPKLIWSNTIFTSKELKFYLNKIEKKWPRKLAEFNEEFVIKILTLCDNNIEKCTNYIMLNEFKKLLMKMKKEKGNRKSEIKQ